MDQEKIKEAVDELKQEIIWLIRSAGNLDDVIQSIERGLEESNDAEYFDMLVRTSCTYRNHYIDHCQSNSKESDAWDRLIEACQVKNES